MKYIKLYLPPCNNHPKGITSWYLVIDNMADLFKYAELDAELYAYAFLNTHKTSEAFPLGNQFSPA